MPRISEVSLSAFLNRLKSLQTEYPKEALKDPGGRDAFTLGRHCGVLEGLLRAEQLLLEQVEEEKND